MYDFNDDWGIGQCFLSLPFISCMIKEVLIKRYSAYYKGWCLAFGEHAVNLDEERDVYWISAEDRFGLALTPKLQRTLNLALLGRHEKTPELLLDNDRIRVADTNLYYLNDAYDRDGMGQLKEFLNCKDELYLFLTNHFCYPSGTRIITLSREKPTILLYKEMQPVKVLIR